MLKYARGLSFTQKPNYDKLRGFLNDGLHQLGLENDMQFDWLVDPRFRNDKSKPVEQESLYQNSGPLPNMQQSKAQSFRFEPTPSPYYQYQPTAYQAPMAMHALSIQQPVFMYPPQSPPFIMHSAIAPNTFVVKHPAIQYQSGPLIHQNVHNYVPMPIHHPIVSFVH